MTASSILLDNKTPAHSRTRSPLYIDKELFEAARTFPEIWKAGWIEAQKYLTRSEKTLKMVACFFQFMSEKRNKGLNFFTAYDKAVEKFGYKITTYEDWGKNVIWSSPEKLTYIESAKTSEQLAHFQIKLTFNRLIEKFPRDAQPFYDIHYVSPQNYTVRELKDESFLRARRRLEGREREEMLRKWRKSCVTGIADQETMLELGEIYKNLLRLSRYNAEENRMHLTLDQVNRGVEQNLMRVERLARWREGLYELPPLRPSGGEAPSFQPIRPPLRKLDFTSQASARVSVPVLEHLI